MLLTVADDVSIPEVTYEYTLRQEEDSQVNYNYFRHKYNAHRWRQREFPNIFGGTPLVFVTPQKPGISEQIRAVGRGDIEVIELSFTHKAFKRYANRMLTPLLIDAGVPREKAKARFD